jgi:hypothetical protein
VTLVVRRLEESKGLWLGRWQVVLPAAVVNSRSFKMGDFHKLWQVITALERSAFKKRMATATALIECECPCGTPFGV